jgi:hypothetical protein
MKGQNLFQQSKWLRPLTSSISDLRLDLPMYQSAYASSLATLLAKI